MLVLSMTVFQYFIFCCTPHNVIVGRIAYNFCAHCARRIVPHSQIVAPPLVRMTVQQAKHIHAVPSCVAAGKHEVVLGTSSWLGIHDFAVAVPFTHALTRRLLSSPSAAPSCQRVTSVQRANGAMPFIQSFP